MLSALVALALSQTFPLITNQTINQTNTPGSAGLSVIGAGSLQVLYTQSGAATGQMTITATPIGQKGVATGSTVSTTVSPSTGSTTLSISPFNGTGVNVTWAVTNPTTSFSNVTLSVVAYPSTADGGTVSFTSIYLAQNVQVDGGLTVAHAATFGGPLTLGTAPALNYLGAADCVLGTGGDAGACYAPLAGAGGTTHCAAASDKLGSANPGCNAQADAGFVAIECNGGDTGTATTICFQ